jgi:glycosyltransferase involved in cell wall biosynthesis
MKIALVSPLSERVPPLKYGGTERIVAYLSDSLVNLGHEVTLYASSDSVTKARLIGCAPRSLRTDPSVVDPLPHHMLMLERVYQDADDYDVVHFHLDYFHFSYCRRVQLPHLTTLHGRLDYPDLVPLYEEFRELPVNSISDAQRLPLPWLNWRATVYHGLPRQLLHLGTGKGEYLAFLGRISPEKGLNKAIEIANRTGLTLKVAAKIDKADREYYENVIRPLMDGNPRIEFIGEIDDRDKQTFLGEALALLFPIQWPEPFGIVMIEAMACGTPIVAFRSGSVPEVMADPRSGFIVNSVEEAVKAVSRVSRLDRNGCREVFDSLFTAERMAKEYVDLYEQLVEHRAWLVNTKGTRGRHHPTKGSVLCTRDLIAS